MIERNITRMTLPQKRLLACLWHRLAIMASMSVEFQRSYFGFWRSAATLQIL